jgi:addiction module RelE/StbE family toxin
MHVVRWTRRGLADAARILAYIALANPKAAQDLAVDINEATLRLERFPHMGRVGYDPSTRELVVRRNYIVVYRVGATDAHVLQVWHVAQRRARKR